MIGEEREESRVEESDSHLLDATVDVAPVLFFRLSTLTSSKEMTPSEMLIPFL